LKNQKAFIISASVVLMAIAAVFIMSFPKAWDSAATDEPTAYESSAAAQTTSSAELNSSENAQTSSTAGQLPTQIPAADTAVSITELGNTADGKIRIAFTGDINLDEKWETGPMQFYKPGISQITDFIDPVLVGKMKGADILFVNNEYTLSSKGEKQSKTYTFRANPANVSVLKELGVDAVSVANNHIYDYKADALRDTISVLKSANITPAGAGENITDAKRAAYFRINGKIIAFVAAGRTEAWLNTPAAGIGKPGILDAYGSDNCVNAIKAAAEKSDYVFVYVHWGTENSNNTGGEQLSAGQRYINAGADAVIGAHPHVLQGMDFYNGKFIAYSLGNFWFNLKDLQSGLLELVIDDNGKILPQFTPCYTSGGKTFIETDKTKRDSTVTLIESVSPHRNITIDENGLVREK
jgi:poly-gamma-glutamate capsule biosynthesis protein CapA/YwtB (metallophosphatase superfamily)